MRQLILNKLYSSALRWLAQKPIQLVNHTFEQVRRVVENKTGQLITIHPRPRTNDGFNVNKENAQLHQQIALVLQGQIVIEDDFTLETIRIYKKIFPGCTIILSTWKDDNALAIEKCRAEGIEIVLNEKPEYFGNQNINLQIASTKGGLERAQALGRKYLAKTRTDQRIYDKNALALFQSLMDVFPLREGVNQQQRLIATNLITLKYRYYGLSDMCMFGVLKDMADYWDVDFDMRGVADGNATYTIKEHSMLRLGEMYFLTKFVEKKEGLEWTLEHTWKVYGERFCIVDFNMVGLYWNKYESHNDNKYNYYNSIHSLQRLSFADWLSFYNRTNMPPPEELMEKNMGEVLMCN